MDTKKLLIMAIFMVFATAIVAVCLVSFENNEKTDIITTESDSANRSYITEDVKSYVESDSESSNDPGAFYSKQDEKMHYTGDIETLDLDEHSRVYYLHKGNNEWEMLYTEYY